MTDLRTTVKKHKWMIVLNLFKKSVILIPNMDYIPSRMPSGH